MSAPTTPIATTRFVVVASHPAACICGGLKEMSARLTGAAQQRTIPCPHCTNAGPLLRWITKETR